MDHIDDTDKYHGVEPGADQVGLNPKDLVGAKKAPLGLVPPALVIGAAEAMQIGAVKYGPFNWREQPIQYMTYVEAMQRHLLALIDGQDTAEDTGVHHLKHVLAGGGILLDAIESGRVVDNRPAKGPAPSMLHSQDKSTLTYARAADIGLALPGVDFLVSVDPNAHYIQAVDGTEGGDVVPGDYAPVASNEDLIGCPPETCDGNECGIHDPVNGLV